MPTLRSLYSFEQFEEVLQKLAHKIAIDAVTNLQGDVRVVIHDGRIYLVETGKHTIVFHAKHIAYTEKSAGYTGWLSFEVEKKLYMTSNHSTKISYFAPEGEDKEIAEKITRFIDKIIADASIKPVPRFTLTNVAKKK